MPDSLCASTNAAAAAERRALAVRRSALSLGFLIKLLIKLRKQFLIKLLIKLLRKLLTKLFI